MKKVLVAILFIIIGLHTSFAQPSNVVDEIIAIVGGEIITRSELEKEYATYAAQYNVMDNEEETRCLLFSYLLRQKLYQHQSEIDSLVFTDQEVDARVNYQLNYWLGQVGGNEKIIDDVGNQEGLARSGPQPDDCRQSAAEHH